MCLIEMGQLCSSITVDADEKAEAKDGIPLFIIGCLIVGTLCGAQAPNSPANGSSRHPVTTALRRETLASESVSWIKRSRSACEMVDGRRVGECEGYAACGGPAWRGGPPRRRGPRPRDVPGGRRERRFGISGARFGAAILTKGILGATWLPPIRQRGGRRAWICKETRLQGICKVKLLNKAQELIWSSLSSVGER